MPAQANDRKRVNPPEAEETHPHFFFPVHPFVSIPFFSLLPFCLLALLSLSRPSVIHSQSLLHQKAWISKWSAFPQLRWEPSYAAWVCVLEKKKKKTLTSSHEGREIRGWKDMHKPTYTQKCGSSIYCPHLYLAWYSEAYQWLCNDKGIMAIPAICLPNFQRFPLCPQPSSPPSLNNGNTCYNLSLFFTWHSPIHAETSPLFMTSILVQQPLCRPAGLGEVVISAPGEFNLNGHLSLIKWAGEHSCTSLSANSDHCSNEHAPSALIQACQSSRAYATSAMCAQWPLLPGNKEICFWWGYP